MIFRVLFTFRSVLLGALTSILTDFRKKESSAPELTAQKNGHSVLNVYGTVFEMLQGADFVTQIE